MYCIKLESCDSKSEMRQSRHRPGIWTIAFVSNNASTFTISILSYVDDISESEQFENSVLDTLFVTTLKICTFLMLYFILCLQ